MIIKEVLDEIVGVDERRITKSAITFENIIYKPETKETSVLSTTTLKKPSLDIERHGDYIQIDLNFVSSMDNDLKILWNNVELFGKNMNDLNEDIRIKKVIPISSLTIIPLKYDGKYFAVAENPIFWALTSKKMGQNANVIRLLYKLDKFKFYQNDDVDMNLIDRQVQNEILYENRQNALMQQKTNENTTT